MQRRHSSNTEGVASDRSRSQAPGSESGPDDGLKPGPPGPPQQMFSGLVGVPSGAAAQFQAAGLVLGAPPERPGSREEAPEDPSTPAPALSELKAVVTWLQRGFPFILILLAKVCFQHKLGIAVCVGMASTFAYANATFRQQVALRVTQQLLH
ncbi:RING finger and transmembrane domain-containing protein 2 [Liparis tanakae]|uniref:RING finger and transmembrane domain-containing protein 2 n=1 Tax=Liparis tanakae TaxID=230148 RepID=A0A4Z2EKU4_9TELE|nr:RING finger and transmembrane domain-containing protein 2 [Liparis tanakae]